MVSKKIISLINKCFKAYSEGGLTLAFHRVSVYLKMLSETLLNNFFYNKMKFKSGHILFINGCFAIHPTRYRVYHQYEQLINSGVKCDIIYYSCINDKLIDLYDVFYIYRCIYTSDIASFIDKVHKAHKKCIFDIDDLVIEPKYTKDWLFIKNLSKIEKDEFERNEILLNKTMTNCDAVVTSTESLKKEILNYTKNCYVWRNKISYKQVEISEKANCRVIKKDNIIRMGYFSGSNTHDEDFRNIKDVLIKILKEYKTVHLVICGNISKFSEFENFKSQLEFKQYVSWKKLPFLIKEVDINLAPLTNNVFNDCKSEIKWSEAALVRVPTIASRCGGFKEIIENNATGILCSTGDEWYDAIKMMIDDKSERDRISKNAYNFVIENCTTMNSKNGFISLIDNEIIR